MGYSPRDFRLLFIISMTIASRYHMPRCSAGTISHATITGNVSFNATGMSYRFAFGITMRQLHQSAVTLMPAILGVTAAQIDGAIYCRRA